MIRRVVPFAVVPLALIACVLASTPWLRAYPASVLAGPLFGAALLSVLVPVITVGIGVRRLWQTGLIEIVIFIFYTLLIALHEPVGFTDLYDGIAHGPSQILTFALPLVSPRTLLVAPVTLCWIAGAVVGECVARSWHSVLPYATLIVTFGLAYAATARAISSADDGRRYDTLLAAGLLLTLLLMRAAQAWIEQDLDSEATQPDGVLPMRGLGIGVAISIVVTLAAATVVQSSAFSGPPASPARTPPLDEGRTLSPLAFVASLRPGDPRSSGRQLFTITTDRRTSSYIGLADVDYYDGDGWSFDRTFRPSGGVVPVETDPSLRAPGTPVTQEYRIAKGPLTSVPWMPFLYRPSRITGTSVDVDTTSGMVVPANRFRAGTTYTVVSTATPTPLSALPSSIVVATSTPPSYLTVPGSVSDSLGTVVTSLESETRTKSTNPVAFLQALARDLRTNYSLTGGPLIAGASGPTSSGPTSSSPAPTPSRTTATTSRPVTRTQGAGTGFANVLASILGPNRSATPEQYATLVALVARQIGVPARIVTGFRLGRAATVGAGFHQVTSSEAWTWTEIPVQGRGWVVVDAAPSSYGTQTQSSASARPSPSPTPTATPNGLVTQANRSGNAVASKSRVPHSASIGATALTVVIVAIAVAAVLLILLALVLRKRLRVRRRQRIGDPRRRLVGAWQESLDVLVESGLPELSNLTSAEVAAATQEHFGAEPAAQARFIGESANAVIFSPSSWVGHREADAAWQAQLVLRRSVQRRLSWPKRIGSGLRYHRPPRVGRRALRAAAAREQVAPRPQPRNRHRAR